MGITYEYYNNDKIIRTLAEGELQFTHIFEYLNQILDDTNIETGFIEIVDLTNVTNLTVSYNESSFFPEIWEKYIVKGLLGTIIIAPGDLQYGIIRMLQSVILSQSGMKNLKMDNFYVIRNKNEMVKIIQEIEQS